MNKTCSKCRESKELSEFHNSKKQKDGKNNYCKACANADNNRRMKELFAEGKKYKAANGIRRATSR